MYIEHTPPNVKDIKYIKTQIKYQEINRNVFQYNTKLSINP